MRILALADESDERLWNERAREKLQGVDLILSAGDIDAPFLSFLTCFTTAPIVYIHGNHDEKYAEKPPEGCICAEDRVVRVNGVRILGLGGCMFYRPGRWMLTEKEMRSRISALRGTLRRYRGIDILLTHAPAAGVGDQQDVAHRGFECFKEVMDKYEPTLMIHGHVHQSYSSAFIRSRKYGETEVINACGSYFFDLPELRNKKTPSPIVKILERRAERKENGYYNNRGFMD